MPHEMDRQQAAQAQQLMMQQQQQYSQYNQNQHWQQPTQNMAYAGGYGIPTNVDYEKAGNGEAAAYAYGVDPNEYYANQRAQQQYMQHFNNPAMFAQQQQQQAQQYAAIASYGQMAAGEQQRAAGAAANFNPGAPPPQAPYARPPPAVKRAEQTGDTGNIHGSPLSVFENQQSSAAYTASWVSSTSSLPPDLKESPEDAHLFHHGVHGGRATMPGNEWVQPGGGTANAAVVDYGGTWGERRDESMFAAAHATGGVGTFDPSQFARMSMEDNHHQSYSSALAGGVAATGGEWNSPEKNHPQQGIKFQTNAWQTNNLNQSQIPPQPLMTLQQQQQQPHQQQQNMHQNKGGKPMAGFSPMGAKQGGNRGNGDGYKNDGAQSLSWEERLKKAQGAKERAERPEDREPRHYGNSNGNNGGPREGGLRGRGGGRGRGGRGGERSGGDREGHNNAGGGAGGDRSGGSQGWKGGAPEGMVQAQGGDAGGFPMMPFGMQGMQQQGGWRGGMPPPMRGAFGGSGVPSMQMQMRGAAAAAARGAVHPTMMRGPMGGFPMMPPTPNGGMPIVGAMHAPQEERFRSTWLDANMCLPGLMGIPGAPMMNPMMMGGRGGSRGGFGGPRGAYRGGRGGGRGRGYYNNRESPRQRDREAAADGENKEDERTPADSPKEGEEGVAPVAAAEEKKE